MPSSIALLVRLRPPLIGVFVASAVALAATTPAAAQSTWLGGQTAPAPPPWLWSNAANWSGGVPTTGGNVIFADPTAPSASLAATRNDIVGGVSLSSITVNATASGPVSIGGNGLTLTGTTSIDMFLAPLTQSLTIALDAGQSIVLGGSQTWLLHNQTTAGSAQTLTISSPITGAVGADLTYGVIPVGSTAAASSSGTIQLLAANTYAGNTNVGGPNTTYVLGTNSPWGTGTVLQSSFNSPPRYQTNGPINISNAMRWGSGFMYTAASTGSLTFDGPISLVGGGVGLINRVLNNASALPVTINGTVTTSEAGDTFGKVFIVQPTSPGTVVLNGPILDNPAGVPALLSKSGTGTAFFNNPTSTIAGLVALQNGIAEVASLADQGMPSALGTGATTPEIRVGNVATAATLRYVGSANVSTNRPLNLFGSGATAGNAVVDSSGTGTMSFTAASLLATGNGSKALVLTGTNAGLNTIGGIIPNANATAITSVQKTGTGTWQLTGASTYTGTTQVTAGTLLVNNATGSGTGPSGQVTVSGTGVLGGGDAAGTVGFISNNVALNSGGSLAPGNSVGTLTATGGTMTWNPSSIYRFEYDASATTPAPIGTTSDLLRGTGTATLDLAPLGGGPMTITLLATNLPAVPPTTPVTYTIADFSASTVPVPVVTPGGVTNLTPFFTPAGSFQGTFAAALVNGNQVTVTFTPVPEPAAVLFACTAGAGLTGLWRRYRNARR